MQLVLGTVQFGMPYGITRATDAVADDQLEAILGRAESASVSMLDTSPAYGDAESRLGAQGPSTRAFRIQTKTDGRHASLTVEQAERDFQESLSRLQRTSVDSLLVHNARQLLDDDGGLLRWLLSLRERDLVGRLGVSVYDAAEVDETMRRFTPDVVQLPLSLADQRLHVDGTLARLKGSGIVIQARSVFLQGLLLTPNAPPPGALPGVAEHLQRLPWHDVAPKDAARYCFGYVNDLSVVDEVVVGTHSLEQLDELVSAWRSPHTQPEWAAHAFPADLVDPRIW